ncbi:radical SAM protein [Lentisphaerota bacterium WC36G]|nr:radical SAM protein [Lentisphaerae bacterium WC36]UDQ99313.1 radical SAM protein [Lentisphaerae bacterium WC36]UDQ99408.1 radical SAM protein [Lentisphaerae bacterium WC36]
MSGLICLVDVDSKIPNLALMKISAFHKLKGNTVKWFEPLFDKPSKIYQSKVFTFTKDVDYVADCEIVKGGTGYDFSKKLPPIIESMTPDYSIYDHSDYAIGFLTRGCPNKCSWCVVPKKEGDVHEVAEIERIAGDFKQVVLLDNNVLASEFGIKQIEKIATMPIKIDFNQGLDARLIDDSIAKLLAACKWIRYIRLACDTVAQMPAVEKAVKLLRKYKNNVQIFVYVLVKNIADALKRVEFLRKLNVNPFAQPFRDFENNIAPNQLQKDFARWVNHKAIFKSVPWHEYNQKQPKFSNESQLQFNF